MNDLWLWHEVEVSNALMRYLFGFFSSDEASTVATHPDKKAHLQLFFPIAVY